MTTSIINIENINFPLMGLTEGETTVLVPDIASHELVSRNFEVFSVEDSFIVKESEYEKIHKISKELIENLSNLGFEEIDIVELITFIHECLSERDLIITQKKISEAIMEIACKVNSPMVIFSNFKQMTIEEVIRIILNKTPYKIYHEVTSYYEEDDYSDCNRDEY